MASIKETLTPKESDLKYSYTNRSVYNQWRNHDFPQNHIHLFYKLKKKGIITILQLLPPTIITIFYIVQFLMPW